MPLRPVRRRVPSRRGALRTGWPAMVLALPVLAVPVVAAPAVAVDIDDVRPVPATIAAGASHSVFLAADGTPYAVGTNTYGEITGTLGSSTSVPRAMTGLPSGVTGVWVSADTSASLVVGSDGEVYAAGRNQFGELGNGGQNLSTLTPIGGLPSGVDAVAVDMGNGRLIALGNDGHLYGAGTSAFAPLPGIPGDATSLTRLADLPGGDVPAIVQAGTNSYAVVATDGSVYTQGQNNAGQLMAAGGTLSTWTAVAGLPSGYVATGAALGTAHLAVLLSDGSVWTAGDNGFNVRGTEDPSGPTPTVAPGLPTITGLAAFGQSGYATLAIGSDGTAYGAGFNVGQFGVPAARVFPFAALAEATPIGTIVEGAVGNNHFVVRDSLGVVSTIGQGTGAGGTRTSLALLAGQPLVATATPTITGDAYVGRTLTAVSGTWAPSVGTSSFQWRRNGSPVGTGTTYDLTAADRGAVMSVVETRTATDFVTGTATSLETAEVTDPPLVATGGAVTISGEARTGITLTGTDTVVTDPAATGRSYQWLRDGTPVGAASEQPGLYPVTSADVGARIALRLTATRADFSDLVVTSTPSDVVVESLLAVSGAPSVTGTARVGQTLTATDPTTFTPAADSRSYQWLRDGVASGPASATLAPYELTPADRGTAISLRVTGSRATYPDASATSTPVTIGAGQFAVGGVPVLTGTARVAETLTVGTEPMFTPTPESVSYQWLRDGVAVGTATTSPTAYPVGADDLGAALRLRITATRAGYDDAVVLSAPTAAVAPATFTATPVPTIAGVRTVGSSLTATAGASSPAADSVEYQWLRDGAVIPGATASTYLLAAADAARSVSVRVRYVRAGFTTSDPVVSAAAPVSGVILGKPRITGTAKVGKTLRTTLGTWNAPGYTFAITWLRAGKPIPKATKATYKLTKADAGKVLAVRVLATKPGYPTLQVLSTGVKPKK